MRFLVLLVCLIIWSITTFGQKITYNIPSGYEKNINKDDYKKIVDAAVSVISKRYTIDYVQDGIVQLKSGQNIPAFPLHAILKRYIAVGEMSKYNTIVQEYFEYAFSAIDEKLKVDPTNYETIKQYLTLRIYPLEMINQRGGVASVIGRTDLEGTYTVLMLDLPRVFSPVDKAIFDRWKQDTTSVFKIALENIDKQQVEKVTKSFDVASSKIEVTLIGEETYAASYALDLIHNAPELVGEWGSAVAIPNRGLVNVCKISKDKPVDFVLFIQKFKPLIEKYYSNHEQPISDQVFWYYKGKFTKINVLKDAKGAINVISPFGLTELMTKQK